MALDFAYLLVRATFTGSSEFTSKALHVSTANLTTLKSMRRWNMARARLCCQPDAFERTRCSRETAARHKRGPRGAGATTKNSESAGDLSLQSSPPHGTCRPRRRSAVGGLGLVRRGGDTLWAAQPDADALGRSSRSRRLPSPGRACRARRGGTPDTRAPVFCPFSCLFSKPQKGRPLRFSHDVRCWPTSLLSGAYSLVARGRGPRAPGRPDTRPATPGGQGQAGELPGAGSVDAPGSQGLRRISGIEPRQTGRHDGRGVRSPGRPATAPGTGSV